MSIATTVIHVKQSHKLQVILL